MTPRSFTLFTTLLIMSCSFSVNAQAAWWPFSDDESAEIDQTGITEITWDTLIPSDFVPPENPLSTMSQEAIDKLMDGSDESNLELERIQKELSYAPVVPELDGQRVKIAAYITPLEFDNQSQIKEFLLVPYVGACIHVPPPPANQVVHAQSPEAIEFRGMYEPVWAIGTIRTETVTSTLAESGYRLDVEKVFPYSQKYKSR